MIAASAVNVPPVPNSMSGTNGGLPTCFLSARSTKSRSCATCLSRRAAGHAALLGHADRAELRVVDLVHQAGRGQHDFGAAAADVGHGHFAARDVERPRHAQERQPRFLGRRDDFDRKLQLLAHAVAELGAVLGVAQCAGADRANLARAVAIGDRKKVPQHIDRGVGRFGIEPAGFRQRGGQPRVFALFVEHAVAAGGQHLGHHEPNAVGPDINRGDTCASSICVRRRSIGCQDATYRGLPNRSCPYFRIIARAAGLRATKLRSSAAYHADS